MIKNHFQRGWWTQFFCTFQFFVVEKELEHKNSKIEKEFENIFKRKRTFTKNVSKHPLKFNLSQFHIFTKRALFMRLNTFSKTKNFYKKSESTPLKINFTHFHIFTKKSNIHEFEHIFHNKKNFYKKRDKNPP